MGEKPKTPLLDENHSKHSQTSHTEVLFFLQHEFNPTVDGACSVLSSQDESLSRTIRSPAESRTIVGNETPDTCGAHGGRRTIYLFCRTRTPCFDVSVTAQEFKGKQPTSSPPSVIVHRSRLTSSRIYNYIDDCLQQNSPVSMTQF